MTDSCSIQNEFNRSVRTPIQVWCLMDSRPGHRNQVFGLSDALQRQCPVESTIVEIRNVVHGTSVALRRRGNLPPGAPQLLIGAGHGTHIPLVLLARRFRAASVVMMKPSFPLSFFDLCLIPDVYDFRRIPDNVITTAGVLNRVQPSPGQDPAHGLALIGGPCSHRKWSDTDMMRQLESVMTRESQMTWQIATSRRTPPSAVALLQALDGRVSVVTPDEAEKNWLSDQFARCGTVWVTADSVSMLCESVTSGARTGVIELAETRHNRAVRCVRQLVDSGDVTLWSEWNETGILRRPRRPLAEADRCATEILRRGFTGLSARLSNRAA